MTWSAVTSGANESWSAVTHGSTTWTKTQSDTTARNTSRFVLLGDQPGQSGITLMPHFRTQDEGGRGFAFYLTVGDPVVFSINSRAD